MGLLLKFALRNRDSTAAYKLYRKAGKLDEDENTIEEAERLYRRAIHLDPCLSLAHTNLGNILFKRGDRGGAKKLYEAALEVDPRQPEALYNLGFLLLEAGKADESIPFFEKAINGDPDFADAHFNLAMALEGVWQISRAQVHWRLYLKLEPEGVWSEIAARHLR